METKKLKPTTIKRKYVVFKAFFKHLSYFDIIPDKIQFKTDKKLPKTLTKTLTIKEVQSLITTLYTNMHEIKKDTTEL